MKKYLIFLPLVLFALIVFSACNSSSHKKSESTESHNNSKSNDSKHKDCGSVHWAHHEGEEGPENWKNLCDGFSACGGLAQSPIDITESAAIVSDTLAAIQLNYGSSAVDIINNGHTVQFNTKGNQTATINGKEYRLLQFHYHALSEHEINGEHYPIEVHFVHKHSDTDFAVIGIMYAEGNENELLASYLSHFPETKGNYISEDQIDISSVFPSELSYYYYSGSLTTPPCTEVVNWYVLKKPLEASKDQIEKFSEILHHNFRPVMPLNNRNILSYNE